jgi:hypothetical protein
VDVATHRELVTFELRRYLRSDPRAVPREHALCRFGKQLPTGPAPAPVLTVCLSRFVAASSSTLDADSVGGPCSFPGCCNSVSAGNCFLGSATAVVPPARCKLLRSSW